MPKQRKIKHYRYGYSSKRQRRSRFWKALLFVLFLAALVFIGYCATKAVRNLTERPEEQSESIVQEENLAPESSFLPEPESSIVPEEPNAEKIRAVVIPQEHLTSLDAAAAFLDTVDPEKFNTAAADLKNAAGTIFFKTESELAASCQAVSPNALDAAALAALIREKGFSPAARIWALEDDLASHASYNTSYLYQDQAGVTWLDRAADKGGRSWMNPYMPETTEYLSALTAELTAAGFETLFVCGIQYPNSQYPEEMGYGPNKASMTPTEALQNVIDCMESRAETLGGRIIPVFAGEGYQNPENALYSGSANLLTAELTAPLLEAGKEAAILAAVEAAAETLVPVISSDEQLSALESYGITQYLID